MTRIPLNARKSDLIELLSCYKEENGDELNQHTNIALRAMLEELEEDEETLMEAYKSIKADRLEREKEERESMERRHQAERDHEYRLRELELAHRNNVVEQPPRSRELEARYLSENEILNLVGKYEERTDISQFLQMFELQVKGSEVPERKWVSYLKNCFSQDIKVMLLAEMKDTPQDYEVMKKLLLAYCKMSPEKYRQKYFTLTKKPTEDWKTFLRIMECYFDEWVQGFQADTREKLRDLMIVDQLKKRIPQNIREHFVHEWSTFISPRDLVAKIDAFELIKSEISPRFSKPNFFSEPARFEWKESPRKENFERVSPNQQRPPNYERKLPTPFKRDTNQSTNFDRRYQPKCFSCGSPDHLRPQCTRLREKSVPQPQVNKVGLENLHEYDAKFMRQGKINNNIMTMLRDSGSTLDVVSNNHISPEMLNGEKVWVNHPFLKEPICLPLAELKVQYKNKKVLATAIVLDDTLDSGMYLLGNRTAALL